MNITITNNYLTAVINPQGAELTSLKDSTQDYMWEGNPEFWGKHSPILFPIVGTLKNNTYTLNGNEYSMTRHGFARDNHFNVKEHNSRNVIFSFTSNDDTKKQFPFDFELELKYELRDKKLSMDYTVRNTGNTAMPFSLGAHPAFALPDNFNKYSLHFETAEPLISSTLENDLISDKTIQIQTNNGELPLFYDLFKDDALILKSLQSDFIEIKKDGVAFLKVEFNDFPHLGIWTKQDAPFICIEPWQGYSDSYNADGDFTRKDGIVTLQPQEEFSAGFSIETLR